MHELARVIRELNVLDGYTAQLDAEALFPCAGVLAFRMNLVGNLSCLRRKLGDAVFRGQRVQGNYKRMKEFSNQLTA